MLTQCLRGLANGAACLAALVVLTSRTTTDASHLREWSDIVERYDSVKDYTAFYEKEERAIEHGVKQRIRLSFRKPLDVRLEWLDDAGEIDQVAVYRQGYNDGKVVARRRGFLGGLVGVMRLDVTSARALADSRHPITQTGLGFIIAGVAEQALHGELTLSPAREDYVDGEPHDRIEITSTTNTPLVTIPGARHSTVWIDRALALPTRIDISDDYGELLERHRFRSIRLNVGLTDEVFTL